MKIIFIDKLLVFAIIMSITMKKLICLLMQTIFIL